MKVFDPVRSPIRLLVLFALLLLLFVGLVLISFPGRKFPSKNATVALVQNIATAITQYPVKTWTWPARPNETTTAPLWDLNHDGLLDGLPAIQATDRLDGGFTAEQIASGYTGCYDMIRPTIAVRFLSKRRQIVDAWGKPLRIAFAEKIYGAEWFGLWSVGPDGIDGTADDIRSWAPTP